MPPDVEIAESVDHALAIFAHMSEPDCVVASILTGVDCSALDPITTGCPAVKLVAAVPPFAIESGSVNGNMAVVIAQNEGAPLDPLQLPNTVFAPAVAAPVRHSQSLLARSN